MLSFRHSSKKYIKWLLFGFMPVKTHQADSLKLCQRHLRFHLKSGLITEDRTAKSSTSVHIAPNPLLSVGWLGLVAPHFLGEVFGVCPARKRPQDRASTLERLYLWLGSALVSPCRPKRGGGQLEEDLWVFASTSTNEWMDDWVINCKT